jgi:hypothetical protein
VDPETLALCRSTQETVNQLVEACHKRHRLYARNPRAVAQVSRTAKWLLNAIDRLQRELGAADPGAS